MAPIFNNSDLVREPAQHLQLIARNGSADDEYESFDDLDPATLLQSLADFDHAASHSDPHHLAETPTFPEHPTAPDHHFESLLQAVATAGGEQATQAIQIQEQSSARPPSPSKPATTPRKLKNAPTNKSSKRKRQEIEDEEDEDEDEEDDETVGFIATTKAKKRRRQRLQAAAQLAREREIWGPECGEGDGENGGAERQSPPRGLDARAAGVHSAAALFRRPSAASRKYTRPPMAAVFTGLEINAELFLQLQAGAKKFMLDPDHPERADGVGNRGKGDTDLTKLKLFSCAETFLKDDGWGERCWGKSAPDATTRKLQWPESKQKIMTLVISLLRRMVTNERQRLYALEARQAKRADRENERLISPTPTEGEPTRPSGERLSAPSPSPFQAVDPKLDQYHYNVGESSMAQKTLVSHPQTQNMDLEARDVSTEEVAENLMCIINIMQNSRRIKPRVTLPAASCLDYSSLLQHIGSAIEDENLQFTDIKVLGPGSWFAVGNEDEWKNAIAMVKENVILDGEVRCAVQVGETGPL